MRHSGVFPGPSRAVIAIDRVLDPVEKDRKFEVTLTAVIDMKADCPDLRLQVAQGFMEYIRDGLHFDPNYLAEVMTFKEIL